MDYQTIILLLIVILILVGFLFAVLKKSQPEYKKKVAIKIAELNKLADSNEINQLKSALFEADKLLDYAFRSKRIKGETLGERLKNAQKLFEWKVYQNVWEAHKLRNRIAHEMDFHPKPENVKNAYINLRKAISSL